MEGTWGLKAQGPGARVLQQLPYLCYSAVKLVQLLPLDQWESQGSWHVSSFPKVSTSPLVSTEIGMHISECWLEPQTLQSSFRAPVLFRVRLVRQVTLLEAWLVRDRIEISFFFFFVLYRLYFRINRWPWLIKFLTEKFYLIIKDDDLNIHRFVTSDAVDGLSRDCQWIKPLDESLKPMNTLAYLAKGTLRMWSKILRWEMILSQVGSV